MRALKRALDGARERRELADARHAADRELVRATLPPLRFAWRAQELVATKHRLDLARDIRSLVRSAGPRYAINASPVNRPAVRAESAGLLALADRIADLERPITARGVLLAKHLLVAPSGPLYDRDMAEALPFYVDAALEALEPR